MEQEEKEQAALEAADAWARTVNSSHFKRQDGNCPQAFTPSPGRSAAARNSHSHNHNHNNSSSNATSGAFASAYGQQGCCLLDRAVAAMAHMGHIRACSAYRDTIGKSFAANRAADGVSVAGAVWPELPFEM
jgi:hypothetical protein